jgi:hypothetical protein
VVVGLGLSYFIGSIIMDDFKYQMHVMSKLMIVICIFCNLKHSIIIVSFQFEENKNYDAKQSKTVVTNNYTFCYSFGAKFIYAMS